MNDAINSLPWLSPQWDQMTRQLRENSFPHAILITAEDGVGKRHFADRLAELLVCEQPDLSVGQACRQCKQCELSSAGTHPDIRSYAPENSRMIRIGQIRELGSFAVSSPQVAKRKIAIIDRADQLNINSANALLKTLEEPAEDVVLILLQETGRPILPTVRSRCQCVGINTPDENQAAEWLASQLGGSAEETAPTVEQQRKALRIASNAPMRALGFLQTGVLAERDRAFDAFRRFMKGHLTVGEAAKPFKDLGIEASLSLFENWAADLARLTAGCDARDDEAAEMLSFLARHNEAWRAHDLLDLVRDGRAGIVNNTNVELEIGRLLIAWQRLMPSKRPVTS